MLDMQKCNSSLLSLLESHKNTCMKIRVKTVVVNFYISYGRHFVVSAEVENDKFSVVFHFQVSTDFDEKCFSYSSLGKIVRIH